MRFDDEFALLISTHVLKTCVECVLPILRKPLIIQGFIR